MNKSAKSFEPERRRIASRSGRTVPIFASFVDAATAYTGLVESENDKEKAVFEAAILTTITTNSVDVLKMTAKSVVS